MTVKDAIYRLEHLKKNAERAPMKDSFDMGYWHSAIWHCDKAIRIINEEIVDEDE